MTTMNYLDGFDTDALLKQFDEVDWLECCDEDFILKDDYVHPSDEITPAGYNTPVETCFVVENGVVTQESVKHPIPYTTSEVVTLEFHHERFTHEAECYVNQEGVCLMPCSELLTLVEKMVELAGLAPSSEKLGL